MGKNAGMDGQNDSTTLVRVRWLARVLFIWALVLVVRFVQVQVFQHEQLTAEARKQQVKTEVVRPLRGALLDRNGQPLAISLPVDSVAVNPKTLPDVDTAATVFADALGEDPAKLRTLLAEAKQPEGQRKVKGHLWVKRGVNQQQAEKLRKYRVESGFDWIQLHPDSIRFYPEGGLAGHLLGWVNFEQSGDAGLERMLNEELEGWAGQRLLQVDSKRRTVAAQEYEQMEAGTNVVTTIDRRVQYFVEKELADAVKRNGCDYGTAVVMNPHTGEIYALAVTPSFDVNQRPKNTAELRRVRRNRAVEEPFEPGSVFKIVTTAAALDLMRITEDTPIACQRSLSIPGRKTPLGDHVSGVLPVKEVIARSSNTGAYRIAQLVGREKFYEYIRRFGFGSRTQVELPFESPGQLRPYRRWEAASMASIAMGHEISSTTVQLAQAGSVIANGGWKVKPTVLRQRTDGSRLMPVSRDEHRERVIQPETSNAMKRVMETVIYSSHGTGRKARLEGYSCAGKTGTARMIDPRTRTYVKHRHHASFVGFAPVNNPSIVVVVTLHNANRDSGDVSAPVFREIAQRTLALLDVPKDIPEKPLTAEELAEPAPSDLADSSLAEPFSDEEEESDNPDEPLAVGPKVPDFHGKSMKEVIRMARDLDLPLEPRGAGVARSQVPKPGRMLKPGERIRVQFGR